MQRYYDVTKLNKVTRCRPDQRQFRPHVSGSAYQASGNFQASKHSRQLPKYFADKAADATRLSNDTKSQRTAATKHHDDTPPSTSLASPGKTMRNQGNVLLKSPPFRRLSPAVTTLVTPLASPLSNIWLRVISFVLTCDQSQRQRHLALY